MTVTLRGETLRAENDTAITTLKVQVNSHKETLKELAKAANGASDTIQQLEDKVSKLSGQVEALSEKCLDLEGRSKKQNLRVVEVTEGKEAGHKMRDFVAQLLKDVLDLDKLPLIDRAHRALRRNPGNDEPPRHLTAKKVMSAKDLTFQGQRIQIFRDLPPEVVKPRAAFTLVRKQLHNRPGIRFGLLYPVKLWVSHNGSEMFFTNPEETCCYVERQLEINTEMQTFQKYEWL